MSEQTTTVSVALPESIYHRLTVLAEASGWTFEEVLLQTIRGGMPPSLAKVPEAFHAQLLALNKLSDKELMAASEGEWATPDDLTSEAETAGLTTLRRAYAYAVLKWRGHPVPDPTEFLL
jgi:hypothetical protein